MPLVQPHNRGESHAPFFEFGQAAVFSLGQPDIQIRFSTRGQHHHKLLAQLVSPLQVRVCGSNLSDLPFLLLIKLSCLADKEPGCTCCRHAARNTRLGRLRRRNFDGLRASIQR